MIFQSCYEGFSPLDQDTPDSIDQPEESISEFDYILYQAIYLSDDAIHNTGCFTNSATATYREREWDLRNITMATSLSQRTIKFVQNDIIISTENCLNTNVIQTMANSSNPWGSDDNAPELEGNLPILHIKAIFWGNAEQSQNIATFEDDWFAWKEFKNRGIDARSYHHFVIDQQKTGFIQEWRKLLNKPSTHDGTFIRIIDPTEEGINSRNEIIVNDTSNFMGVIP